MGGGFRGPHSAILHIGTLRSPKLNWFTQSQWRNPLHTHPETKAPHLPILSRPPLSAFPTINWLRQSLGSVFLPLACFLRSMNPAVGLLGRFSPQTIPTTAFVKLSNVQGVRINLDFTETGNEFQYPYVRCNRGYNLTLQKWSLVL